MVRFTCPSCGSVPDDRDEWLRVDSDSSTAPDSPTVQLLLDDSIESTGPGLATDETVEQMTTLQPCGHSFPHDTVTTVTAHLRVLDELLERHADSTDDFEIQRLREEIRSTGAKLDAAADRCAAQMESTQPHRRGLMLDGASNRLDTGSGVDL